MHLLFKGALEFCVFGLLLLQNLLYLAGQGLRGKWLGQVEHSFSLDSVSSNYIFGIAGDEDNFQTGADRPHFIGEVAAILLWKNDIGQQ